eukprot:TRINITY_DN27584_c0_g1_i3.p1 TRINITY_DN27584_c0_g1~~TRINITY_DN27584_c0_g1_i3.p1  ORF type:complete len:469 (+),score=111.80 TRINITY_DN27584_c0_g1_i3:129-1535(+)
MVCSFFLLNMLLGSGPLTLPYAFEQAGFLLGSGFVVVGAFFAYVAVTFLIEALTISNAIMTLQRSTPDQSDATNEELQDVLKPELEPTSKMLNDPSIYDLNVRFEVGQMSALYFSPLASKGVYLALVLYLYGTLAVYAISVPTSLQKIGWGSDDNMTHYYVYCTVFACTVLPLGFGNFENTKPVQIVVFAFRVTVFLCMIALAWQYIHEYDDNTVEDVDPKPASLSELHFVDISGIAYVFGNAVLTFNCHHSIPGLVCPVRPQGQLKVVFRTLLTFCCFSLALLCVLAMMAFKNAHGDCPSEPGPPCEINKLYNLNFSSYHVKFLAKLLDAYPVLMVALYPLLSITLRNNLLALLENVGTQLDPVMRQNLFTLTATLPMLLFAYAKPDIAKVTSITGAYFGCCIMYLIPAFLAMKSQAQLAKFEGVVENPHRSEFGKVWQYVLIVWGLVCILFSSANFLCQAIPSCSM